MPGKKPHKNKTMCWPSTFKQCSTMKKKGKCSPSISLYLSCILLWRTNSSPQERNKCRHIHPNTPNDFTSLSYPEPSGSCGYLLCSPGLPFLLFRSPQYPPATFTFVLTVVFDVLLSSISAIREVAWVSIPVLSLKILWMRFQAAVHGGC